MNGKIRTKWGLIVSIAFDEARRGGLYMQVQYKYATRK